MSDSGRNRSHCYRGSVGDSVDLGVVLILIALLSSAVLSFYGMRRLSWKPLIVAAGLSTLAAIPLTWSIGPLLLILASIQLGYALNLRQSMYWWTPIAIATGALCILFATIVVSAVLFD